MDATQGSRRKTILKFVVPFFFQAIMAYLSKGADISTLSTSVAALGVVFDPSMPDVVHVVEKKCSQFEKIKHRLTPLIIHE